MTKGDTSRFSGLRTEAIRSDLRDLDCRSSLDLVRLIHEQDRAALSAVRATDKKIAQAINAIVLSLSNNGRLYYVGAGTSGRLGALDAAECPPTFGTKKTTVQAIMAGGLRAFHTAVEGAEDSKKDGADQVRKRNVSDRDIVCGISASGVTPFVRGALAEAKKAGAQTILVTCASRTNVTGVAKIVICLDVGAEALAGSTRMKAGLATKAVLHTLSTASMVRLGKVYDNLMVDVMPTSRKLVDRATRIISRLANVPMPKARRLLRKANNSPKVAIVMQHSNVNSIEARQLIAAADGHLRQIIGPKPRTRKSD